MQCAYGMCVVCMQKACLHFACRMCVACMCACGICAFPKRHVHYMSALVRLHISWHPYNFLLPEPELLVVLWQRELHCNWKVSGSTPTWWQFYKDIKRWQILLVDKLEGSWFNPCQGYTLQDTKFSNWKVNSIQCKQLNWKLHYIICLHQHHLFYRV